MMTLPQEARQRIGRTEEEIIRERMFDPGMLGLTDESQTLPRKSIVMPAVGMMIPNRPPADWENISPKEREQKERQIKLDRHMLKAGNFLVNWLGQSFGSGMFESMYNDFPGYERIGRSLVRVPYEIGRMPREYREGAIVQSDGTWVDLYGNKIPDPKLEPARSEELLEKITPGPLNTLFNLQKGIPLVGGYLHKLDSMMADIFAGNDDERERAAMELMHELSLDAALAGSLGIAKHTVGPVLKALAKTSGIAIEKLLRAVGVRWAGEGFWKIVRAPAKVKWIPSGEFIIRGISPTGEIKRSTLKSLEEVWQPAVERLNLSQQRLFRQMESKKLIINQMADKIRNDLSGLDPAEMFERMKAVRDLPASTEAKKWWKGFERDRDKLQVGKSYEAYFQATLQEQLRRKLVIGEREFTPSSDAIIQDAQRLGFDHYITQLTQQLGPKHNLKKVIDVIDDAIRDPMVPNQFKNVLTDLRHLPMRTPMAIANSAAKTTRDLIEQRLMNKGVASLHPFPNSMRSRYGTDKGMKGLYVPKDIELELRAMHEVPQIAERTWMKYFMTPWKTSKVILRPATHFRNLFSNLVLNDMGGLPFFRADIYARAIREMIKKDRYWLEWTRATGGGATFVESDLRSMARGLNEDSHMWDHLMAVFDKYTALPRKYYGLEEQWFKMAKFIHNREERGMDVYEAAMDAMKYTFNYGEITRFTAHMRGKIAPFFTWSSKVLPLFAETWAKHPLRIGKWWAFYEYLQNKSLEDLRMTDDEWKFTNWILPEYIKDGQWLLLANRDDKGRLQFLNLTYMIPGFGDYLELMNDPAGEVLGSPILTMSAALLNGRTFNGAPLWYEWEEPSAKVSKFFRYMWKQLTPAWMYGGIDWDRMEEIIQNDPEALTAEQMIARQFGLQIQPVDELIAVRKREVIDNIYRGEMASQMKRALRESMHDPNEFRRIIEEYHKRQLKFETERFKVPRWYSGILPTD